MPLAAVLDASVLFPMSLCDILLRTAERDLYKPLWSERIMAEVRHVPQRKHSADVAQRVIAMSERFPRAMVPPSTKEERKLALPDLDDRHVVATAVVGCAAAEVRARLRGGPAVPGQLV